MPDTLTKLAYQAFQQGKSYFGLAHKTLGTQLMKLVSPPPKERSNPIPPDVLLRIQQRLTAVNETDWQDAEQGVYPVSVLFENDWDEFFRYYPLVWIDMPSTWERANQKRYQDIPPNIDTSRFPNYYVQNFHHQTDGYLSDWSANLYDLQVDILFNGAADPMRRRVLSPLKQGLQAFEASNSSTMKVLDVACGTGRTLRFIRATLPQASLYGVDLSDAYLRKANQLLSKIPGELPQLIQANGEELPYQDDYFHGVTSVFLFHELPATARQNVIIECFRVTKPGGVFVICDSIQLNDSPDLAVLMEGFPASFHEPYYRHYVADDLVARLQAAGFTDISTEVHFMSKYWVARKPATSPSSVSKLDGYETEEIRSFRHSLGKQG
ncbi:MAG: class I SAM-dependent methyltransferase [Leptolyngbyaceae cyanobacterium bins.302]|nr:class I SAM-dependent methyltransferase [Leptolyngbyaceae cyanobacterium bins.302]